MSSNTNQAPVFSRNESGELLIEDVSLHALSQVVGTPYYAYSTRAIEQSYNDFRRALGPDTGVCYAVKANGNLAVLRLLAQLGCGMDIVSGGELFRALEAGAKPGSVVFSGVGKSRGEIEAGLLAGIHQFNVESAAELELISSVATELNLLAPVAIRVNPNIDALTHEKISTGRKGDKFGVAIDAVPDLYTRACDLSGIRCVGLAVHIGSQITSLVPYRKAYERVAELVREIRKQGKPVERLDLGGGIGIDYGDGFKLVLKDFAAVVRDTVGDLDLALTVEPGRRMVGEAGVLVSEVLYTKPDEICDTVIIDAGMNDLLRPAMYEAVHPATMIIERAEAAKEARIVGPVCESSDAFGAYQNLPALRSGDLIAFLAAGAYGASMSSTYNARALIPEVLVTDDRYSIVRRRQNIEDQLSLERDNVWSRLDGQTSDPRRATS